QWDAFGYYQYLPATFIYHDLKTWKWADDIDRKYNVTGGGGLPVVPLDNGNKVCKYFGGVAILQLPFFAMGHCIAGLAHYPQDGFSAPYQYSLAFGAILYSLLALVLLMLVLRRFFSDVVTAITLVLLTLASNFLQYSAVHSGLSHVWIFPLYALILYTTMKWHEAPKAGWALLTGLAIGIATICRPTEAIAIFIPIFWNYQSKEARNAKWQMVRAHQSHVVLALIGGLIGILPQLLYWKYVTGSFVFDVGSKWTFLNPWFRVLFGFEKGWFIYTPVCVFFVLGFFFIRRYPFRLAVLAFCLLNIWIVISWDDWHYGASYSCRALVQSYPVFALPLAAFVQWTVSKKWFIAFLVLGAYLVGVNLFQVVQYNSTILHYDDNNALYYRHIYLNPSPSPLTMSLLDTQDWLSDENEFKKVLVDSQFTSFHFEIRSGDSLILKRGGLLDFQNKSLKWMKVAIQLSNPTSLWKGRLVATLGKNDSIVTHSIRLFNPIGERNGQYAFYLKIPDFFRSGTYQVFIKSSSEAKGTLGKVEIFGFY
ncbi:MAG: glycosyltransferase family 39 protein, partial [Chitinophagaceae bacterium]